MEPGSAGETVVEKDRGITFDQIVSPDGGILGEHTGVDTLFAKLRRENGERLDL
jgi:hypothetical protein